MKAIKSAVKAAQVVLGKEVVLCGVKFSKNQGKIQSSVVIDGEEIVSDFNGFGALRYEFMNF